MCNIIKDLCKTQVLLRFRSNIGLQSGISWFGMSVTSDLTWNWTFKSTLSWLLCLFATQCSSKGNSWSWYQWKEDMKHYNFHVEHLSWINLGHVEKVPTIFKVVTEKHLEIFSKFLAIFTTLNPQLWNFVSSNSHEILV